MLLLLLLLLLLLREGPMTESGPSASIDGSGGATAMHSDPDPALLVSHPPPAAVPARWAEADANTAARRAVLDAECTATAAAAAAGALLVIELAVAVLVAVVVAVVVAVMVAVVVSVGFLAIFRS
jgi:hypothetical protein